MKKFFILMLAMITVSVNAYADGGYSSCKVSGGNGATVSASIMDWDQDGYVTVQFSSDCDDYVAVSFTLTLDFDAGQDQHRNYVYTVKPNCNDQQTFFVCNPYATVIDATVEVGGARCEQ